MYIAIAGNIGSGKTSLTEILAKRLDAKAYFEDSDNPYIGDFYEDMSRWSFNLQIYFLGKRIQEAAVILNQGHDLIQDRTIFEDAHIFAANLHECGLMATRDFDTYMKIFDLSTHLNRRPDLLIYLQASVPTLIAQIQKRGRAYEMNIQPEYLEQLNDRYKAWIETVYPGQVLVIDIDTTNFIDNPALLEPTINQILTLKRATL